MIRIKISHFIKKHKAKLQDLGVKLIMVAMIVFSATIILSSISDIKKDDNKKEVYNVYKPTQTVIQGGNISVEQYQKDTNLVNTFLEHCNNKEIEEAYSLLSDECKQESYPTIEMFKTNYYNTIFNRKREFNLQSWLTKSNYTVYRIRYTNNMLATGTYDENDVYQDYITLNRKDDTEKISIGNFVDAENLNIVTETEEIIANVIKKRQYMTYEEYDIQINNKTYNNVLVSDLYNTEAIKLISRTGTVYGAYNSKIFMKDLLIAPIGSQKITIRFKKNFSSTEGSKEIVISNFIKDYDTYIKDKANYNDVKSITINVGD